MIARWLILSSLLLPALQLASPPAAASAAQPQAAVSLSRHIRARTAEILDQLQSDGEAAAALAAAEELFDQVIAHARPKDLESFREAAFAVRLLKQLAKLDELRRIELLPFLRNSPTLARTLAFLIDEREDPIPVYALLDRLRADRGPQLEVYASLAAAICVVHDRPLARRFNGITARSPDPLDIFDYFVRNERRMLFGLRTVPPELLTYVVDTTASISDMEWALKKHAGNTRVGLLFFVIKYDYEHLRTGAPKRVEVEGFTLPNILQFGGVCSDQAYFAASVGKAIGVPTAYTVGISGEVAHAWVGFFQLAGRTGGWNFDVGRYDAYRGLRGVVADPQTRRRIPDSYVSLLAGLIGTKPEDRHASHALTDAARRLIQLEQAGPGLSVPAFGRPVTGANFARPRKADLDTQLDLLEMAVRQSPGNRAPWFVLRDLAKAGRLSSPVKNNWASLLLHLCGQRFPDFTLAILAPMIETVEETSEQHRLWNLALELVRNRADLAAEVRMAQAALWERAGNAQAAELCYLDVIHRYANAGPFVIAALARAEQSFKSSQREDQVLLLYDATWGRIQRPKEVARIYFTQSNWYKVGRLYAEKLEQAGLSQRAAAIRALLEPRTAAGKS